MRSLPAAVLSLLSLVPAAASQEAFSDPDFDFRMKLPVGMRAVSAEERAVLLKISAEESRNLPRADAAGGKVSHSYIWVDESTPYNRQIGLGLYDGLPPFRNPTELKQSQVKEGITIEREELLAQPVNAAYIEGTTMSTVEQVPLRRILLYIPDFGGRRYAVVTMQAFAADWDIVKAEFDETVKSVKMKLTPQEVSKAPAGGGKGAGGGTARGNAWASLPVAGSFVLAAVIIGSLVLGRRKPA